MGPLRSTCALKAASSSLHRRSVPPSNSQAPKTAVNCTTLILRRSCGARASKDAPDGAEAPAANPCSKWRILESSFETRLRRSSGRGGLVGAAAQKCSGKPGSLGVPEDFYPPLRISMPRSPTALASPCLQAPTTSEGNSVSDFRQGIVYETDFEDPADRLTAPDRRGRDRGVFYGSAASGGFLPARVSLSHCFHAEVS
jgi:hypothetical protein